MNSFKYTIVIPSTYGLNEKADTSKITDVKLYVAKELSKLCGGCTVTEAEGYYVADNGELVIERVAEMYTIGKAERRLLDEHKIDELAQYVKQELKQECVLVNVQECNMELV